jgi:hypothetical protein
MLYERYYLTFERIARALSTDSVSESMVNAEARQMFMTTDATGLTGR